MNEIAIKAENIGKLYRLGQIGTGTISHDLNRWWAKMRGKEDPFAKIGETNDRTTKGESEYVWALQDINFEIKKGEAVGIIGRNGAGKSTLLKLLSKVTSPTTGCIKVNGRIASLLEVGTGFHPEMTGRENIFLNGAILGMTKREISRKFDEIVDFSGVERYIDTPVKRYSSGMYVRLAFAVAAHLESEILIVDEVLAVGDADFQKKCLGKMGDVSKSEGRTVLFVSHNMAAVSNLCEISVFMHQGLIKEVGPTKNIIDSYISSGNVELGEIKEADIKYLQRCPYARFNSIRIISENEISSSVKVDKDITIEMDYTVDKDGTILYPSIHLLDNMETVILATFNGTSATLNKDCLFGTKLKAGTYRSICVIPGNFLNTNSYSINAFLVPEFSQDIAIVNNALKFSVEETGEMRKEYMGGWIGLVRPKLYWETKRL